MRYLCMPCNYQRFHRARSVVSWVATMFACLLISAAGRSITLAWNESVEAGVAGYRLHYGTGSGALNEVLDVGRQTKVAVHQLEPGSTYFFAVQAYDVAGAYSGLSREVAVTTPEEPLFFANWAAYHRLSGSQGSLGAVPHADGTPNLLKYGFGMDGSRPDFRRLDGDDGEAGLPVFRVIEGDAGRFFEVQFLRRRTRELIYQPMVSDDMKSWAPFGGTETVSPIDSHWERVTRRRRIDEGAPVRLFGRVGVTVVHTPRSLFDGWAQTAGLAGVDALPSASPMGDGVNNLQKYAFNLDPDRSDRHQLPAEGGVSGLPGVSLLEESDPPEFELRFVRRRDSGLVYTPQISTDLVRFVPMAGVWTVEAIDSDWERVRVRKPLEDGSTRLFGRVLVTLP